MNESYIRNVIEAALLAAGKPLQPAQIAELFEENQRPPIPQIQAGLQALVAEYSGRGIEIKETAQGFRIQVRRELASEISRLWPERPARYSRALLETLALIAYRQPITRAEIEAVRGVAVNPNILKTMIERNWVRVVGHRDVPGRPELLGTTHEFLDYFGMRTLDELPPLAQLKALGEIKLQFDLPDPGPIGVSDVGDGPDIAGDHGLPPQPAAFPEGVGSGVSGHKGHRAATAQTGDVGEKGDCGEGAERNEGAERSEGEHASEAEKFVASIDADLAAGDDDSSDEDELSAVGPSSGEMVAGPRDLND
jgi:segregation and condensation protein B